MLLEVSILISYRPYLNGSATVDLSYITFLVLGVIIITILDLVKALYLTEDAPDRTIQDFPQGTSSIYDASEAMTVRQ
jgi:hypothetical protein